MTHAVATTSVVENDKRIVSRRYGAKTAAIFKIEFKIKNPSTPIKLHSDSTARRRRSIDRSTRSLEPSLLIPLLLTRSAGRLWFLAGPLDGRVMEKRQNAWRNQLSTPKNAINLEEPCCQQTDRSRESLNRSRRMPQEH